MSKKISVGLSVTLIIIFCVITAFVTTAVTMNIYNGKIADLPERENMYSLLSEADGIIRKNYYGSDEQSDINGSLTKGYLEGLKTGTNYYLSADDYAKYKQQMQGINPDDGSVITSVTYKKYGSAGYIKISSFTDKTPSEFRKAYQTLVENSVSTLILDLRDTESLNIKAAAEITDMIVPVASEGTKAIATAVDKNNTNTEVFSADSDSISMPVSVIVNENTAGAGELIACDVRDFGKGTIVGKTTKGCGTYQKIFEMSDGSAMILTVAKLVPYTSECYDTTGIKPDYDSDLKEKTDNLNNDTQFLQAYAVVSAS